jgi:hypothetical protein
MPAVCNSCLRIRSDLTEAWISAAASGKRTTTHYCSDDFAFAAPEGVSSPSTCPACRNSNVVIPVDEKLAKTIARFVARARRDPE